MKKHFKILLLLSFFCLFFGMNGAFLTVQAETRKAAAKIRTEIGEASAHVIPAGAAAAGFMKCLFDEAPQLEEISPDRKGNFKWFSGQWYASKVPEMAKYSMKDGVLTLAEGGDLVSYPPDFSHPGLLPTLSGKKGFYVEFEVSLSENDPDHFPAVWLMPVEKNGQKWDVYPGSPKGFERWMELDVDEGGFGPGLTGTVHCWWGIYPNYRHIQNPNNVSRKPLDRTQSHRFGASYDPRTSTVCWWVDDEFQMSAAAPFVPEIAKQQHFYLIMGAQTHKEKKPYQMRIHAVRAFEPAEDGSSE